MGRAGTSRYASTPRLQADSKRFGICANNCLSKYPICHSSQNRRSHNVNARTPLLRRIAFRLIDHAGRILPPSHAIWARAMKHELHHIEGDLEGLRWAAGCVIASYIERGGPKMDHSFGSMVKKHSAY